MRILKASVIIMGVLIVLGVIGLVYVVVNRAAGPGDTGPAANGLPDPDQAALVRLGMPAGTTVRQTQAAPGRVILHLSVPGQGDWIYVIPTDGDGRILKIAVTATE